MSVVACQFMGRFGNNMFQYAYARAYAEKHGHEFQCDPWDGQKIFKLDDKPVQNNSLPRRDENTIVEGEGDISIRSYCQQQKCLIYTHTQVQEWLRFSEMVELSMREYLIKFPKLFASVGHRRSGDYLGYGYPVVSEKSYRDAFEKLGVFDYHLFSESDASSPLALSLLGVGYISDFYCMAHSELLLRGNSTFSWWAAALNRHGKIYSPVMEGCEGGKEHDVEFVEGNHPRFRSDLSFITDLHLQP